MPLRTLLAALLWLTAGLSLPGAADSQGKIRGLLNNSPFGRSGANEAPGKAAAEPFEFRAILEEGGVTYFSVYDASAHRSSWVRLNEPLNGFTVKEFDAEHTRVRLEYKGSLMTLPIQRARAIAMNSSSPLPPGGGIASASDAQAQAEAAERQQRKIRIEMASEALRQKERLAQSVEATN